MGFTEQEKESIVSQYESGKSSGEIGRQFGVRDYMVLRNLKKWGIERRTRKYSLNEAFFDHIDSEEKAYFLGLLYADGCVTMTRPGRSARVVITLQLGDIAILEKFRAAIHYTGPVLNKRPQAGGTIRGRAVGVSAQATLALSSQKIPKRLNELGCTPRKSFTLTFPEWMSDDLLPHFVRGYIDGDGWIVSSTSNVCLVGVIGSTTFIKQLAGVLSYHCGVAASITNRKTKGIDSMTVSGRDQVSTVLAWLYKGATVYLERKKRKAEEILTPTYYEGKTHGDNCYRSILTEVEVREIKQLLLSSKMTLIQIAERYGVSKSAISHIRYGTAWSAVTGWTANHNVFQNSKQVNNLKLTEPDVIEIVRLLNSGLSNGEIAAKFNVKREQIRRIASGERWASVTARGD